LANLEAVDRPEKAQLQAQAKLGFGRQLSVVSQT
jgi:hypothetical protein